MNDYERNDRVRGATSLRTREDDNGNGWLKWLLVALAAVLVAAVLFFTLGGDADVDVDPGNVDVDVDAPEVDADVDAPDVDVEVPDVDVDVEGEADVDVDDGDAEAEIEE